MGVPTLVSTFAGCGGSSLGYALAGFGELLAIDWDDNAEETFRANFPEVPFWNRDIAKVSAEEILEFTGLKRGELCLLDGSPPCQGFSHSGKRKVDDKRNDLSKEFTRLLEGLQPKAFVMENMPGMAHGKMKGIFNEALEALEKAGYKVRCKVLNAKYYNVPQSRRRLIWIGYRLDLDADISFPRPSARIISLREALKGVSEAGEVKKPGGQAATIAKIIKRGRTGSRYHPRGHYFNLAKLSWARPSPTILKTFSKNLVGHIHPDGDRFLTIPELKRVCSFPDHFILKGRFEQQWARLGNAVMPELMKAVALSVKADMGWK